MSPDNRLNRLTREIHRRSLWQVLGIYLVGGWVAFEVVHTLTEGLGLPEWFPALAVVLLIIGFPMVMATAFVQEGAGEPGSDAASQAGVAARDREMGAGGPLRHLTWRNALLGGLGAFGLWGVAATMWLLAGAGASFSGGAPSSPEEGVRASTVAPSDDRPAIAVLPFENMSGDPDDEYFTDGMHEEILSRLSKVGGLRLISRTSVLQYEDSPQNIRQIAEELGVGYVGEGSVRRAEDVVRITVQLIDASSDEHLWSETYDRELSPAAIFDIQSDVAQRIAEALHTELSPEEAARVAERPTQSAEAYDYYLLYRSHAQAGNSVEAIRMLRRATEVDPTFTGAWASLAIRHVLDWWTRRDFSDERLELARAALERARDLDPDHTVTLRAQGDYFYYVEEDWERAAHYLERAVRADPNSAQAWEALAYLRRRTGEFQAAIDAFTRAEALDPASNSARENLADTYAFLRRWDEAHAVEARARLWNPTYAGQWMQLGTSSYREGDVERARTELRQAIDEGLSSRIFLPLAQNMLARTYVAERRYDEALHLAEGFEYEFAGGGVWEPRSFLIAQIHDAAGREEEARAWYDSARIHLEPRVEEDPRLALPSYGLVLAGLGREEEAVAAGRRGVELTPIEHDAFIGTMPLEYLARIYAGVGELDAAVELVEDLLARPSFLTVARLRMEPYWDPLREHPRFRALLADPGI